MEFDVVVVGAGPAGLAAAIRLKQINQDVSVVVVEKGSEVGAHILSGAVIDPVGLDRLLPDWRSEDTPIKTSVTDDRFYYLSATGAIRLPNFMRGIGERLSAPIALPVLSALLVNPLVPLATRDVFGKFAVKPNGDNHADAVPKEFSRLIEFLQQHNNDLVDAACACAPVIGEILESLRALPGARLVRMSGSGPT